MMERIPFGQNHACDRPFRHESIEAAEALRPTVKGSKRVDRFQIEIILDPRLVS